MERYRGPRGGPRRLIRNVRDIKTMIPGIWTSIYAELDLHAAFRALHACGWRAFEVSTEHLAAIDADPDPQGRIEEALRCLREMGGELHRKLTRTWAPT